MQLTFYGGVGEVTGANYLIEEEGTRILIDCGLHQGGSFAEKLNWQPLSYDPKSITAVFVTHPHIDHVGRLPLLVKNGFSGRVYSTPPARDAVELLLIDSQHILEQEADRHGMPMLCAEEDIKNLMKQWDAIDYHEEIKIGHLSISLYNAGHILGSSFIAVSNGKKKVVFSGDLGNSPAPLIGMKEELIAADYCVIESTYGGRIHEDLQARKEIVEDLIEDTAKSRGVLMIPAFAMERTQELLFEINQLAEQRRVPRLPIFLDSPLAIKLTDVYKKYQDYLTEGGINFDFPGLKKTLTVEESKSINNVPAPKVVIAGSGMSHGGRILHHERRYLPDPNSALLIIGYQAQGSLGRKILDGEKTVKIFGEEVAVNCRVRAIGGYSAHADQPQLLSWLKPQRDSLTKVFVIQGEEDQSSALVQKIKDELAVEAIIPEAARVYNL